jgi:hypothetical protein
MAVSMWYQGRNSETSATVIVRADSTENVDVVCNGVTKTAACNTSVNDGNALVEFTGLAPGGKYPYTVGGVDGGFLKTKPTSGVYWLAFASCWSINRFDSLAKRLVTRPVVQLGDTGLMQECVDNLIGFYNLGDKFYCNISGTVNGQSLSKIDDGGTFTNAKDQALRYRYHLASMLTPGVTDLIRSVPTYLQKDDHDYDPDNASYSVDWLDFNYGGPYTQTDLDDVWNVCTNAFRAYSLGNPERVVDADYFKVSYHNMDVFVTDLIQERDYIQDADGPTKYMISPEQEEQFLSDIGGSNKPFKTWASTKQFISSCGRNSDGWYDLPGSSSGGCQTQLNRILSDPRFPSAGALSVTGDEHLKSDMMVSAGYFGGNHPEISQISAGPATIEVINDPNDGSAYRSGVVSKERVFLENSDFTVNLGENSYVLFRVLSDRIERYVLGSRYGLRYMGYITKKDNKVNWDK